MNKLSLDETDNTLSTHLTDFDWKLKLCVASDKLASVDKALVNLDFHLKTDSKTKVLPVELDQSELSKLIEKLETAQEAVSAMKAQAPLDN